MDNQKLSVKPRSGYGFIYCYTSPSGKKYIGQTKTTLKERAQKNAKGYKGCKLFYNAIKKYGWENFEVEILEEVHLDFISEVEIDYIVKYDTTNRDKGYNIASETQKWFGVMSRVPVYSYNSETGEFIEGFESITEAARQVGSYRQNITHALNTRHRVKGRLWRTEKVDSVEISEYGFQPHSKAVYVYDAKTGAFLFTYSSIREAAREMGYNRKTIIEQLRKDELPQKAKKYIFRYYKVDNLFDESSTTIQ